MGVFYRDMSLVCRACGESFIFTAGEQEYYSSRGLLNEPTRCPVCRRRPPERGKQGQRGLPMRKPLTDEGPD